MDEARALRILVVDDHALFRRGVVEVLALQKTLEVVGEAADGVEAIERARETRPDVILMDHCMPRMGGLEAMQAIKAEMPEVHIVVLSVHDDNEHLFGAIRLGADGYLLKNIEAAALLETLDRLRRGEAAIHGDMSVRILHQLRQSHPPAPQPQTQAPLTDREVMVLARLARGETNKEIAEALVVTEHTVKMHVRNILDKLHLQNRSQAAVYALREGLVEDPSEPSPSPPLQEL